jgi:hypothetical protein
MCKLEKIAFGRRSAPGLQLVEGLLLSLDQLLDVLDAAGSDVAGGAEHDAVQELDVGLQLVAVGVALPVQVDLDLRQDGLTLQSCQMLYFYSKLQNIWHILEGLGWKIFIYFTIIKYMYFLVICLIYPKWHQSLTLICSTNHKS